MKSLNLKWLAGAAVILWVLLPLRASPPQEEAGAAMASAGLAQQLLSIEKLPDAQHAERLRRLHAVQAPPGSLDALEHLFLLATTEGAPAVPDAHWRAWEAAASAQWKPLAATAQRVAELHQLLRNDRFSQAAAVARTLPVLSAQWPPLWRARALMLQARAVMAIGDPEAALLLRLQAIPLLEELNAPWRLSIALGQLAFNYARLNQHERALAAAQESLRLAEQTDDLGVHAWALNYLSGAHSFAGRYEAGRIEAERALTKARQAQDERLVALLLGNLADAYINRGDPARALALSSEGAALAQRLNASNSLVVALNNRGLALIQLGQVAKGREDLRQSVTLAVQHGNTAFAAVVLNDLGRAMERVGDLPSAYHAFIEEQDLRDTQTRKDRSEALAQAQSQFDGAQREREAQKLRQQTALQAETIRSQWLRFGLIALALVSGVVLLLIVGWLLRKLKHTNRKLAATNQDLAARSELDPLTGLGNRRRLQRLLSQQDPTEPLRAGLLLLDIDFFKQINDQYGHAAGDMVLTAVAGRMKRVAPQLEGLMRWGGEEFLVLMLGANAEQTTAAAAKTMEVLAGAPVSLRDGRSLRVTVSVGAVALPLGALALSAEQGVDLADALMYRAKSHGRNQAWCLEDAQARSLEELMHALSGTDAAAAQEQLRLQRLIGPGGSR